MRRIDIRAAQINDAAEIAKLAGQLGYPTSPDDAAIRLGNLITRPDHVIFVATTDSGRILGWVHVFDFSLLESQPTAEIGGLVVDQNYRGGGVGHALVEAAEDWSRQRGHSTLWVHSNTIRTDAHRFYTKLGFSQMKTQVVFMKTLESV